MASLEQEGEGNENTFFLHEETLDMGQIVTEAGWGMGRDRQASKHACHHFESLESPLEAGLPWQLFASRTLLCPQLLFAPLPFFLNFVMYLSLSSCGFRSRVGLRGQQPILPSVNPPIPAQGMCVAALLSTSSD